MPDADLLTGIHQACSQVSNNNKRHTKQSNKTSVQSRAEDTDPAGQVRDAGRYDYSDDY